MLHPLEHHRLHYQKISLNQQSRLKEPLEEKTIINKNNILLKIKIIINNNSNNINKKTL